MGNFEDGRGTACSESLLQACYNTKTIRFPPAFLFSQKSKIFDSFPPGEAKAAL